ncbi:MAG: hypothetical protein AAGJ81_12710 [Verrucomicrobiota bacterium]
MNLFRGFSFLVGIKLCFFLVGCERDKNLDLKAILDDPTLVKYVEFDEDQNGFFLRIIVNEFNEEFFGNLKKSPSDITGTGSIYRGKVYCENGFEFSVWVCVDMSSNGEIYYAVTDSQEIVDSFPQFYWISISEIPYWNNWLMLAAWSINYEGTSGDAGPKKVNHKDMGNR